MARHKALGGIAIAPWIKGGFVAVFFRTLVEKIKCYPIFLAFLLYCLPIYAYGVFCRSELYAMITAGFPKLPRLLKEQNAISDDTDFGVWEVSARDGAVFCAFGIEQGLPAGFFLPLLA